MVPISFDSIRRYPVTAVAAIVAIAVTLWGHKGGDAAVARLVMSPLAWHREPWRLITSTFYHVDILHLLFNLYWLWYFGVWLEHYFGSLRTAAVLLLLAVGSELAEYALMVGGVGLSGVGYGLFGLMWVLSRRDSRFRDLVSQSVVQMFVAWFFLCIVLTVAKVMPVGNVAHGAGFVLGVLLAWTILARSNWARLGRGAVLAAVTLGLLAAASLFRSYVNFVQPPGYDEAYLADDAMDHRDPVRAVRLYERALAMSDRDPRWWYNLGVAYERCKRPKEASRAFQQAHRLNPNDAGYKKAAEAFKD
jgi:membrane associated rhomboid family serine protease